jgi:hypothetical protein
LREKNRQLELTEDIKEIVLRDHFYKPETPTNEKQMPSVTINQVNNQILNNFNMINNMLNNLSDTDKLSKYLSYNNKRLTDHEDYLENKFANRNDKLENNKYNEGYLLQLEDIYKVIDDVTCRSDDLENMNILYDKDSKRFRIYSCGKWESFMESFGIKTIIRLLKSYFLDNYEKYLLCNLYGFEYTKLNRVKLKEYLDIYYHFLASMELDPIIATSLDEDIFGRLVKENEPNYMVNRLVDEFIKIKKSVKKSEINGTNKKILNLLKDNHSHNLKNLNKSILEILKVDEEFSNLLMDSIQKKGGT